MEKHLLVADTSTFCNYVYTNKQWSEMKMTEGPFKLCTWEAVQWKCTHEFWIMWSTRQLNNRKLVNTIPYADDHILMATSEDELQTVAYHLNLTARKYKMTISSTKTKSMATCGNHTQRVKIVINDNIIEQVTDFKYLGYRISEYKSDLEDKLQTYNKMSPYSSIYGAIQRHFGK